MKLTIELVPKTSWGKNVRSMTSSEQWNNIRQQVFANSNHTCEVCNDSFNTLHAHEVWSYNMKTKIQKLTNIITLCEKCHLVKHFGYANISGKKEVAEKHLMLINNLWKNEMVSYITEAFDLWRKRSKIDWIIDISYIDTFNGKLNQE